MSSKRSTSSRENSKNIDKRLVVMDEDTQTIQKIALVEWPPMASRIMKELKQKILEANPPPSYRMAPEVAVDYFNLLRISVEAEAKGIVQSYSPAQWLWYLRRLPKIFGGRLKTTAPYDRQIVELLSGLSERAPNEPIGAAYTVRFPVTEGTVKRTLRLCATAIILSDIHSGLRRTGKGLEFEYDGKNLPSSISNKLIDEAIELFDRRSEEGSGDFGVGGSRVFSQIDSISSTREESPALLVAATDDWQLLPTLVGDSEVNSLGHYIPRVMSVSDLPMILTRARGGEAKWWDPALPALLALVKATWRDLSEGSTGGWLSLVRYGYIIEHWHTLHHALEESLPILSGDISAVFPGSCPKDAVSVVEILQMINAQTWPPLPGPVLRPSGEGVFVDMQAATDRLYRMMAFSPSGNTIANLQAKNFETVVQSRIDTSPWVPSPTLRNLRGTVLRRPDGSFITDLDALGEYADTLLIIDCKSTPYTAEYNAGFYTAVRNIQTTLHDKVTNWARVINELNTIKAGRNYNFKRFRRIVGIVCTPHVFYVPLGIGTQEIISSPNGVTLRAISSYGEVENFLQSWPDA
jgi:hypothetical protein